MGKVVKFQKRGRAKSQRRRLRRWHFQLPLLIVAIAVLGTIHTLQQTRPPAPAPAAEASGREIIGRPTRITDGDTLRIGATRIRLDGIDAPEMSTANGEPARQHLARLVGGASVRCIDEGERSYDRVVAICYDAEGQDLAAAMVRDGWARDWARYSGGRYAALEIAAVLSSRGMH